MAKRRKVLRVEAQDSGGFRYHLSCGHTQVGDSRFSLRGTLAQPKAITCRQCAL